MKDRSGVVICHNNNILLMYRKKHGKEYYTFIGGTIEDGETIEEAAVREVYEESSIVAKPLRMIYHLKVKNIPLGNNKLGIKNEYLILCNYISGVPSLSLDAVENKRQSNNNIYKPLWVPINKIQELLLYPLEIRDLLIQDIDLDFTFNTKVIEVVHSNLRH